MSNLAFPTEAELIELENWLNYEHEPGSRSLARIRPWISESRAVEQMRRLIAFYRQLNKGIAAHNPPADKSKPQPRSPRTSSRSSRVQLPPKTKPAKEMLRL